MAWMGGRVMPLEEARLPLTDWGLIHADSCYDVVPVWDGAFFRLHDYIARFLASAEALRLDIGMTPREIESVLGKVVSQSRLRRAYVAMVVSRGVPLVPGSRDPRHCANHFFAWCVPYVHVIKPEVVEAGCSSAWIARTVFRIPPASFDPRVKNYMWGDFTRALIEAKDNGAETAILLDADGNVTEGPGFNVFVVSHGGAVITPRLGVLEGISRRTVVEICEEMGVAVEERAVPLAELMAAAEIFVSSSAGGVMPITRVDATAIGGGRVGETTRRVRERYWEWVARPALRTEVDYGARSRI